MKFKYGVFCITLRLIVLLPSYSVATEVIAGNVINFEISRDGLQGKMEKLVAKQGIDEKSKAKEMSWYQLADENIADTRWYEFHSSEYQNVLKSAPEQLKKSKNKLKVKVYKVSDQQTEKESELLIDALKAELRALSNQLSILEGEYSK